MKKNLLKYAFMALMSIAIIGCAKDGQTGPQGKQGTEGKQGPKGDKGDKGDKGEQGNANVKVYVREISPDYSSHYIDLSFGGKYKMKSFETEAIFVYLRYNHVAETIIQVPIIRKIENKNINIYWEYSDDSDHVQDGSGQNFEIIFKELGGDHYSFPKGTFSHVKMVVIKGTVASRGSNKTAKEQVEEELKTAGVDISDYNQVVNYYGIK